jgi:hypothetical protein
VPNDFDLVGVRQAARVRSRVRLDRIGPEHPDFASAEPPVTAPDAESVDAAIDFASPGPVVERMRAAFFGDRS